MITFTNSLEGISPDRLDGFFVGWSNRPSTQTHLRILKSSDHVELALDDADGPVVGFATVLTDHVITADLTLLEVLPHYQRRGIGSALVNRLMAKFQDFYGLNLVCDQDVQPFYERLGMKRLHGMCTRNYARQNGV